MDRDDVLISVYGSKFWRDIKKDFVAEAKKAKTLKKQSEFLAKWNYYYMCESPLSTIKGRGLDMRKALKEGGLDDNSPLLDFFKLDANIYKTMNKKASNVVEKNLENAKNDETNYADLADNIISKLTKIIEEKKVLNESANCDIDRELAYAKVFLLSVATGRRQIEILKLLEISKKKDLAVYKNLAKKKASDNDSVVAPILIDVHDAKRYLRDVHEVFGTKNMTNKEVNSKFSGVLKTALKRYLPELKDETLHFFRKIYAEACYLKFADKNVDKNMYFSEILGHDFKPNAAHNYQAKK